MATFPRFLRTRNGDANGGRHRAGGTNNNDATVDRDPTIQAIVLVAHHRGRT
jgi:hypothetical protein